MAELRLAMLGMGKAMSGYLTPSLNKEGLAKVRDGLFEAAGGDLEDLVKEWAWHEGLERSTTSVGGQEIPDPITQAPKAELPKAVPSTTSSLNTPRPYPSPVASPTFNSARASLALSSRNDTGPLASLPRVPQTAHLSRVNPASQTGPGVKSPPAPKEVDPLSMGINVDTRQRQVSASVASGDPLGVGP